MKPEMQMSCLAPSLASSVRVRHPVWRAGGDGWLILGMERGREEEGERVNVFRSSTKVEICEAGSSSINISLHYA